MDTGSQTREEAVAPAALNGLRLTPNTPSRPCSSYCPATTNPGHGLWVPASSSRGRLRWSGAGATPLLVTAPPGRSAAPGHGPPAGLRECPISYPPVAQVSRGGGLGSGVNSLSGSPTLPHREKCCGPHRYQRRRVRLHRRGRRPDDNRVRIVQPRMRCWTHPSISQVRMPSALAARVRGKSGSRSGCLQGGEAVPIYCCSSRIAVSSSATCALVVRPSPGH